ncbi:MAG: hypothetical protein ACKVT0_20440 [Planctomycetaceae bacterium]
MLQTAVPEGQVLQRKMLQAEVLPAEALLPAKTLLSAEALLPAEAFLLWKQ